MHIMKILHVSFLIAIFSAGIGMYYKYHVLCDALINYGITSTEKQWGADHIDPEHEKQILAIADEMGIKEPFLIRKMNTHALQAFGYYNAFIYFPKLFYQIIPVGNTPFLYISEGFLHDISPEEQRFLIGHELIHLKERHVQFFNMVRILLMVLLCTILFLFRTRIQNIIERYVAHRRQTTAKITFALYALWLCYVLPTLLSFAYLRNIEKVADIESLTLLNSYNGCIKFINRCHSQFGVPADNPYWGITADHPSCYERRMYCLELQNKLKTEE